MIIDYRVTDRAGKGDSYKTVDSGEIFGNMDNGFINGLKQDKWVRIPRELLAEEVNQKFTY